MGNSTPSKIVTTENIILKLCIRDYVGDMTHHANFGFNWCSVGVNLIFWSELLVNKCMYACNNNYQPMS